MSLSSQYREGTDSLASLLLSSRLWSSLTGVNVAVQIYNNTPVSAADALTLEMMEESGVVVIFSSQDDERNSVCDEALEVRLSRLFLPSKLSRNQLADDDIVLVADSNIFLSRNTLINVLQSGHKVWMFLSEMIFYSQLPWSQVMAMRVRQWR